ncbi:hypothetical protein ACT89R_29785 (plasmid) [Rhodococcus qingshengii]
MKRNFRLERRRRNRRYNPEKRWQTALVIMFCTAAASVTAWTMMAGKG